MEYLFNDWDKLLFKIQKSPRIFLFFDYDGTITPIVSKPSLAKFPRAVKNSIKKLQKNPKFTIAIISGRSLDNIKKMVGLKGIIYAGNHGMEIEGRGIRFSRVISVSSIRPVIKKILTSLHKEFKYTKGINIEDKKISLSVHYRLVKPRGKTLIKKGFNRIIAPFVSSRKVRITRGKEVLEVRPNLRWDKGTAVTWLLRKKKYALALYLGDDVTDIDAFRALKGKGISIFVGRSKKAIRADYFLKGTKDVKRFIERLLKM